MATIAYRRCSSVDQKLDRQDIQADKTFERSYLVRIVIALL